MNRHEHRLDCIKAYVNGYLSEPTSDQVYTALSAVRDLADGVEVGLVHTRAERPS